MEKFLKRLYHFEPSFTFSMNVGVDPTYFCSIMLTGPLTWKYGYQHYEKFSWREWIFYWENFSGTEGYRNIHLRICGAELLLTRSPG